MRFMSFGPEVCLGLPSDSTSRWTPLPSATATAAFTAQDLHLVDNAHAGHTAGSLAFARDDISRRPRCRSLTPRSAATRGAGDRDVALQGPSSRLARIKVPPLQSRTPNLEKPLPRAYNAVAGRIWKHKPLFSGYAIPRRTYRRGILRSVASNPRLSAKEPPRCGIPSSLSSFKTTRRNHKGGRTPSLDRERTTRTGRRS